MMPRRISTGSRRGRRPALRSQSPDPLHLRIVQQIRAMIQGGELVPGDQLLSERRLAEHLGVGRNSVREALTLLKGLGLLDVKPRAGAFVRQAGTDGVTALLASILLRERQDVYHLLEARRFVETGAARLAAERRTEVDLMRIRSAAARVSADVAARRPADRSDTRFHRLIVDATHNPVLQAVMSVLSLLMEGPYGPSRRRFLKDPARAPRFLAHHDAIVRALAARDVERAESAMKAHIDFAAESLFELDQQG